MIKKNCQIIFWEQEGSLGAVAPVPILTSVDGSTNEMTGHNLPDIPPRSESPVQWQGRIKPTESHIADLKAKDWTDITPGFRTPMSGSSEPGSYVRGYTSANPEI